MSTSSGFDVREIAARLPHRHPLLLVDRVIEVKDLRRLVAIKNVTVNEDFFRGHFPGNPVMPGVLILEALAQASGLLLSLRHGEGPPPTSYLVGLDGVKFRRPVVPGDRLHLEVESVHHRARFWKFRAIASVDGERVAEASILLAVLAPEETR